MKKAWNIIRKIIVWAIVVFSLGMMAFTIISVTTFDRADRSVFGYSAFIVLSDSMKATDFDAGDLVIIKQTDPNIRNAIKSIQITYSLLRNLDNRSFFISGYIAFSNGYLFLYVI